MYQPVSKSLAELGEIAKGLNREEGMAIGAGPVYGAYKARKGRKAAVFGRMTGRGSVEAAAGGLPGIGMIAAGAMRKNPSLVKTGAVATYGGQYAGSAHGSLAAYRNAKKRGDIVTKGMPSVIRQATRAGQQAGKDVWNSTSGANALMFRQKMGQAGASVGRGGRMGSKFPQGFREGQWAKEKYKEQLGFVARQRGNTGGLLGDSEKAKAARSKRLSLMAQRRPTQIQGGLAQRPAW